jgi:hypothetical protein
MNNNGSFRIIQKKYQALCTLKPNIRGSFQEGVSLMKRQLCINLTHIIFMFLVSLYFTHSVGAQIKMIMRQGWKSNEQTKFLFTAEYEEKFEHERCTDKICHYSQS